MHKFIWAMLTCCAFASNAQSPLAIGEWRAHLPYRIGRSVTQSSTNIYYASDQALLVLDKTDLSTRYLSKTEGLSNAGIDLVKYHPGSDVLAVVYSNSVIDLIRPDGVVTLNQIRNFANLPGQKRINSAFADGNSRLYLATSYGISSIDLMRAEFEATTFTGVRVNAVVRFADRIYAATDEGIYIAPMPGTRNIADFNNWDFLGLEDGFPDGYSSKALAVWNGKLYADVNNTLVRWEGDRLTEIFREQGTALRFISAEGSLLLVGFGNCTAFGCPNAKTLYFNTAGGMGALAAGCVSVPLGAIEDEQGRIWFADAFNGFRYVNRATDALCNVLEFNTPRTPNNYHIAIRKSEVWVAAGGVDATFTARGSRQGFYSFIDGIWTAYTPETRPELKGRDAADSNDDLTDFMSIAFHPRLNKLFAASFREGLVELTGDTIRLYDELNSTLGRAVGDESRTRVGGLAFDRDENLWMSNHRSGNPIAVFKKDGSWKSFAPDCNLTEIHQLAIDQRGNKWFVSSNSATGLLVFNEGNMDVNGDERCRIISQTNSNLPSNLTNCVAVDLEGDVWVGTTQGVVIFECGDPFNAAQCVGSLRLVERNGFFARLLSTEDVLSIAVDGADRKWVGTRNGVYLLSPSGEEEVAYFNTDNSPLPDNLVGAIGVDGITGEVFFGTPRGIVSYRADATDGTRFQVNPVQVFPNPVRPEYQGAIAVRGLTRDAIVKITDLNGQLVFETTALGGQAIWDGRDFNGRRVQTGVYLVFAVSNSRFSGFDGRPEKATAKILFVN
jgi:hypothetical protein